MKKMDQKKHTTDEKKKRIRISPVTRLEGHGEINIFLDDEGNVENAYFQATEFRGFERFCQGRPVEEMPRITTRLCGVCPWAHHIASSKCLDDVFKVEPPSAAKKLRELAYAAHMMHSHLAHIYALGPAPDFLIGPTAPPGERNLLGVIKKVGLDMGKVVIKNRYYAQRIQDMIGGKTIHPVFGLPGGISHPITEEQRKEIEEMARELVEFARFTRDLVIDQVVLSNKDYVALITGDVYYHETYYMGLVDENNRVNFYDGKLRVIDPEGKEFARFGEYGYLENIAEHVEPWSYLKFPFLKKIGWHGLTDGKESGIFRVAPLARLNVSDGMATPLAQEEYERMYDTLGGKPAHHTMAQHWARVIENIYAAERALELARDKEVTSPKVRNIPTEKPGEGIGIIEAPRGTLIHHYWSDEDGMVEKVNLIVATGHNNAGICMSVKRAAEKLIHNWKVDQGLLNMVEMAFRAYDPCIACATHALLGETPLIVNIRRPDGEIVEKLIRD
jgi:F420-non-reducing hydrogenase large subunit